MRYRLSAAEALRKIAEGVGGDPRQVLLKDYGVAVGQSTGSKHLKALLDSLQKIPRKLILDCGIHSMDFQDLGPSMKYYPNHGRYIGGTLALNTHLLDEPIADECEGKELSKLDQIFYHELGHGFDEATGKGRCLSDEPEWLELSGWTQKPKTGMKRFTIRAPGRPELRDDWYYSPDAGFPRYYGRRNPWDDWADAFSYYVSGLKGKLPGNKRRYFDRLLESYHA